VRRAIHEKLIIKFTIAPSWFYFCHLVLTEMKARNGEVRKKKTEFGPVPEKDQVPKKNRYEMAESIVVGKSKRV
jgi:hypothetical protein